MFLKSSFVIPPVSGFVAFDGGGHSEAMPLPYTAKAPAFARAPLVVPEAPSEVRPMLAPQPMPAIEAAPALRQSATWQPASGRRVRAVEGVVVLAMCSYFAFGLAGALHWI